MRRPLVVGVQGVHGSGKSRLCAQIECEFLGSGMNVAVLSFDDFYLPRTRLGNAIRGPPHTHDIELLAETISQLRSKSVCVPVFDKTCMGGTGDRVGWRTVEGPVDLVLLRGWCAGFMPAETPCEQFSDADAALRLMVSKVYPVFDAMIVLHSTAQAIFRWTERTSSNASDISAGRYLPYYERYLRTFQEADPELPRVTLHLDSKKTKPRVKRIEFSSRTRRPP